jgi:hypothetical protein
MQLASEGYPEKDIMATLSQEKMALESIMPTMVNMYEVQVRDDAVFDTDALKQAVSNELSLFFTR